MISERICKAVNKIFPMPVHPFNLSNDGKMTYAEWQYLKGQDTIKFYLNYSTVDEMFKDKVVLDIGCGAAGKTIYYAKKGVKKIYGLEILEKYKEEAETLAVIKGVGDKFQFIAKDASKMDFEDNYFDTIIMNDAMEHVDNPEEVLVECIRVLKPAGKLYINFPPYNHPYGAHLSDAISIPWVHVMFGDKTLINVYKDAVKDLPDGKERIEFRISKDENGKEYFSYINKMTIKRFLRILKTVNHRLEYYKEIPLRSIVGLLAKAPVINEFFVKMVVVVITK
ncbi:MAG TPA: class I SAM-dependent methyltransferase [Clostridiales bacterium]|nr:MAG: methyltransferase [Clostridiales bacterium GWD2_32_59]HAN10832.1 class I SAM-dependent methyltransferase [Clostridiales bacterium]